MKTTMRLGDTVSGTYHGVDYNTSGYVYVALSVPVVVYGVARDKIAIDRRCGQDSDMRLVYRPEIEPEVDALPSHVLGGWVVDQVRQKWIT